MPGLENSFAANAENASGERLKAAEDRLARAIGRLQAAADARANAPAQASVDPGLADQISLLKTENQSLRRLVVQASEKLDATIDRLKTHMAEPDGHGAEQD